jgi:hypothetical protein
MKKLLLYLICIILLPATAFGEEPMRSAQLNMSVPTLTWKGIRLKNLPSGAIVAVEVSADNPLKVFLLSQSEYNKYPLAASPVFQGDIQDKLTFSITIPATGHYYLVLDNSKGSKSANTNVKISAGRGAADFVSTDADEDMELDGTPTGIKLSQINDELKKIFIFDPFPVIVNKCGKPDAYTSKNSITLCQEYIAKLQNSLDDREKTTQVLLFVVFHEIGHILLYQWGYPFYDNEGIADEFATVLLIMVGKREQLKTTAKYFASNTAVSELLGKAFIDDRHPLSIQRARNIINWVNDRQRIERWQTIFIPHLQTRVLERWQQEGKIDSVLKLIGEELVRRQNTVQ